MSSIKKRWPAEIKDRAKRLRKQGHSFGRLVKELGVARSTIHSWTGHIKRSEKWLILDKIRWMKEIQPLTVMANKKKREDRIREMTNRVQDEINNLIVSADVYKAILSMLYWAEGGKTKGVLILANTDPKLLLLFITLLRKSYQLDEKKFRLRLNLHYYHKERVVKKFWSELLNIPMDQFQKSYRKYRSKTKRFRQNFGGICFLKYNSTALKEEIISYSLALADKIVKMHP